MGRCRLTDLLDIVGVFALGAVRREVGSAVVWLQERQAQCRLCTERGEYAYSFLFSVGEK